MLCACEKDHESMKYRACIFPIVTIDYILVKSTVLFKYGFIYRIAGK